MAERTHQCAGCSEDVLSSGYSKGQLRKGAARRCHSCINGALQHTASAAADPTAKLLAHELAAKVIAAVDRGGGGVRTALYTHGATMPNRIRPTVMALVSEVLRELPVLLSALDAVPGPWSSDKAGRYLAAVLVHEVCVRGRGVKGGARHEACRAVFERRSALTAALPPSTERGNAAGAAAPDAQQPSAKERLPRYVRVNTLQASVEEVRAALGPALDAKAVADPLVPDLLALPPKTNLHGHTLVETGRLILQDRCSCLPALALAPPPGACVVDACAAPGNKTTQLASMVGRTGTIFAFERNARRAKTLRAMVATAGAASIVRVCEADFTLADASGHGGGQHTAHAASMALCDPSCSGSGGAGGHHGIHAYIDGHYDVHTCMHMYTGGHYDLHSRRGDYADGDGSAAVQYWERVRALAASQVANPNPNPNPDPDPDPDPNTGSACVLSRHRRWQSCSRRCACRVCVSSSTRRARCTVRRMRTWLASSSRPLAAHGPSCAACRRGRPVGYTIHRTVNCACGRAPRMGRMASLSHASRRRPLTATTSRSHRLKSSGGLYAGCSQRARRKRGSSWRHDCA